MVVKYTLQLSNQTYFSAFHNDYFITFFEYNQMSLEEMIDTRAIYSQSQSIQMIIVSKEREEEYDLEIDSRWKEARINFFNHTIQQRLSQSQIPKQHQTRIAQMLMHAEQVHETHDLFIEFYQLANICEYQQQIEELNEQFKLLNQEYLRRQKETPAITQIIQLKLISLRVISIQYSLTFDQQYRYQISAFELFKVVHENRGLSSVTLKGVKVLKFKQFIRAIAQSRFRQFTEQINHEWSWIKEFNPSNLLRIAIDAQDDFQLTVKQQDVCVIKDLAQFGAMFQQLSVISVIIQLGEYASLAEMRNTFQQLQEQLATIGKIRLKIKVKGIYEYLCPAQPFTMVLQMLSSLTTIAQLQFSRFCIDSVVNINRFLAMEEILKTIFESNAVTHLKLQDCKNFPILPTITLFAIHLQNTTFRRQSSFMSYLNRSIPSLRSITYSFMKQEWRTEEELLNALQRVCILHCQNVSWGISTQSPLNIKYLMIWKQNTGKVDGLSALFSKLVHIAQLSLYQIGFPHQQICAIPSPHLAHLCIEGNDELANQGLKAIDNKWPKLRSLSLSYCSNLNEDGWSACEFKGLAQLSIGTQMLVRGHSIRQQLRGRGIKVYQ